MEQAIDPTRQQSIRWHPKITPYRLLVFLTTAVLGTVKAYVTYRGVAMASITLEWVTGAVISLMFNILGEYEYRKHCGWFYQYDCLNLLWKALYVLFDVHRPSYKSDEISMHCPHFSVSAYQILVSLTVITFGLAKAVFTYLGWNTAATTFDWLFAVLVTSILYCIGLYEPNSINLGRSFFHDDYLPPLREHGMASIVYGCFTMTGVIWIILWSLILLKFLKAPWYPQGDSGFIPSIRISRFILMVYLQILTFLPGFAMIRFSWQSIKRVYRFKGSSFSAKRRISAVYKMGLAFLGVTRDTSYPSLKEASRHGFPARELIRIPVRLVIHLVLAVPFVCAAFLFMVGAVLLLSGETRENGRIVPLAFNLLLACSSAGLSIGPMYCLLLISRSLVNSISDPAISATPILQSLTGTSRF